MATVQPIQTPETPRPIYLTIQIPKRTTWPAHDRQHITGFIEKTGRHLKEIDEMSFSHHKRVKAAICLFNGIIAQPAVLASNLRFRSVVLQKLEEIRTFVRDNDTGYEDEFEDMEERFHELMEQLHNHPLFIE